MPRSQRAPRHASRTNRHDPPRPPPRAGIAVAVVGSVLVLAACGSASTSRAAASKVSNAAVMFADCMRSHGVPNFPDPGSNGFDLESIDTQTPAFESAHQTCTPLQPASSAGAAPESESERLAAISNARCMRSHGVPDFPDPKFLPSGGNTVSLDGLDTQSPAFKRAQSACPWPPRT